VGKTEQTISEENRTFGWSNFYRACLLVIFIIPFVDIFIQLVLENWTWLIVSVVFSIIILLMIAFSFRKPFIKLENGELKFYLFPITPVIYQSIKLSEISDYSVKKDQPLNNFKRWHKG